MSFGFAGACAHVCRSGHEKLLLIPCRAAIADTLLCQRNRPFAVRFIYAQLVIVMMTTNSFGREENKIVQLA